jgi:isochorismate synthase
MKSSIQATISLKSEQHLVRQLMAYCRKERTGFAYWRLPQQPTHFFLISSTPKQTKETLEELAPGFLAAPFDSTENPWFLKADYLFRFNHQQLVAAGNACEQTSLTWLENLPDNAGDTQPWYTQPRQENKPVDYISLVQKCIENIQSGAFEKIVPSRSKDVKLPDNFDVYKAFQKLSHAYPNAFVSLVSTPETGTWLGASPEVLVTVEDLRIFRTTALAGTKPFTPGTDLKQWPGRRKKLKNRPW